MLMLQAIEIPYIELRFTIAFRENASLPEHKVSALRGGMGQALLRRFCDGNRDCESCPRETSCLVRQMMYAKYEIQPPFATRGDSNGYVLDCDSVQTFFLSREPMRFGLTLYGKLIPYLPLFVQAFADLGEAGLGKARAQYDIVAIEDSLGEPIWDAVDLPDLEIQSVREYALGRREQLLRTGRKNQVIFLSPVTLKYEGRFLEEFAALPFVRAVYRRIYALDCFLGKELPLMQWEGQMPEIRKQRVERKFVPRYSETQGKKMTLRGIQGILEFDEIPEELLLYLLAGEVLRIGKNTSFGFGRYLIR